METSRIMNKYRQDDKRGFDFKHKETSVSWCMLKISDRCDDLFDFVLVYENKLEWFKEGFVIFHSDSLTQMESLKQYLWKAYLHLYFLKQFSEGHTVMKHITQYAKFYSFILWSFDLHNDCILKDIKALRWKNYFRLNVFLWEPGPGHFLFWVWGHLKSSPG